MDKRGARHVKSNLILFLLALALPWDIFSAPVRPLAFTSIQDRSVVPANWLHPLLEWKDNGPAGSSYILKVSGSGGGFELQLVERRLVLDDPRFPPLLAGKEIRFELRRANVEGGLATLPQGSADRAPAMVTVLIDPSPLDDCFVYRMVEPLFNPGQAAIIETRRLADAAPKRIPSTPSLCIGCHSYSNTGAAMNVRRDSDRRLVTATSRAAGELQIKLANNKIGELSFLCFSPDGRTIALAVDTKSLIAIKKTPIEPFDMIYVQGDIALYDIAVGRFELLPGASSPDYVEDMPFWSPDGKRLVFARYPADPGAKGQPPIALYTIDVNGGKGGMAKPLLKEAPSDFCYFPHWSPDGKWISFVTGEASRSYFARQSSNIWLYSTESGKLVKAAFDLPDAMESWHGWSSDSKWLVFSSKRDGNELTALYVSRVRSDGKTEPPFKVSWDSELKTNLPCLVPDGGEVFANAVGPYLGQAFGGTGSQPKP